MEIYLLRHGIAEEARPGQADPSRRLTAEGREKLARILACARKAGVRPDVILSSPYKRAMETAAMAQEALKAGHPILETDTLTPMRPPELAWEDVRLHREAAQVMAVGHEPHMSNFAEFLTGGRVEMKKGAIARVDVGSTGPRPDGVLVWLLTAKLAGG